MRYQTDLATIVTIFFLVKGRMIWLTERYAVMKIKINIDFLKAILLQPQSIAFELRMLVFVKISVNIFAKSSNPIVT